MFRGFQMISTHDAHRVINDFIDSGFNGEELESPSSITIATNTTGLSPVGWAIEESSSIYQMKNRLFMIFHYWKYRMNDVDWLSLLGNQNGVEKEDIFDLLVNEYKRKPPVGFLVALIQCEEIEWFDLFLPFYNKKPRLLLLAVGTSSSYITKKLLRNFKYSTQTINKAIKMAKDNDDFLLEVELNIAHVR